MAYITPDSIVRILKDVPLDNTYKDTISFQSATAQANYFAGKTKYNNVQYTYLRKENKIRVEILADNLYDCNYIMFQNKAFGSKWFYAFITNVEYLNNVTSAISYEIDEMQTWYFNYTLKPSFVEREHSSTDEIGDNLIPETLETGEFLFQDLGVKGMPTNWVPVICATVNEDYSDATPGLYNGIYQGCKMLYLEGINATSSWLENLVAEGKSDAVITMFMFPKQFIPTSGSQTEPISIPFSVDKHITSIDGYTPKNKKLFTYPYNFLYVTDNEGKSAEYRYEYFTEANCRFDARALYAPKPEACIIPQNYKNVENNYNERMTLGDFPMCSWQTDPFMAWLAMNATQLGTVAAAGVGQILAGVKPYESYGGTTVLPSIGGTELALPGSGGRFDELQTYNKGVGIGKSAVSGAATIAGLMAKAADTYILPPRLNGANTGSMNMAIGEKGFHFYYAYIKNDFARMIDDFWSMFGYPCRRVKVPARSVRPHWTYTKTVDVNIVGSIPAGSMAIIKGCYNRGITFWKNGDEVGNYNLDNSLGGGDNGEKQA